jgi:hypothetical protein
VTIKLLAAAAGLFTVASTPVLVGALVPVLGVAVAAETAYVVRRLRHSARRSSRHVYGA